jgi:hypothetical protein
MQTNASSNPGDATPEPLGLKEPLLPATPLGQNWFSPKFLTPLGAKPLAAHDPLIFSPQGIPDYQPPGEAFEDLPFFPDRPHRTPPPTLPTPPTASISEASDAAKTGLQPRLDPLPIQRQIANPLLGTQPRTEIPPIQRQTSNSLPARPQPKLEASEQPSEKPATQDFHSFLQEVIQSRSTASSPTIAAETASTISSTPSHSAHSPNLQTQLETSALEPASSSGDSLSNGQTQLPGDLSALSSGAETSLSATLPIDIQVRPGRSAVVQPRREATTESGEGLPTLRKNIQPELAAKANIAAENPPTLQTQIDSSNSSTQPVLINPESNLSSTSIDINSTENLSQTQQTFQAFEPEVASDGIARSTQVQQSTPITQPEITEVKTATYSSSPSVTQKALPTIQTRLQPTQPRSEGQESSEASIAPASIPQPDLSTMPTQSEVATEPEVNAVGKESHPSLKSEAQSVDSVPSVIQTRSEATTAKPEGMHSKQPPASDLPAIAAPPAPTINLQSSETIVPASPLQLPSPSSPTVQPKREPSTPELQQDTVQSELTHSTAPAIQLKPSLQSQQDVQERAIVPSAVPIAKPTPEVQASSPLNAGLSESPVENTSEDVSTAVSDSEFLVSTLPNTTAGLNSPITSELYAPQAAIANSASLTAPEINSSTLLPTVQTQRGTKVHEQPAIEDRADNVALPTLEPVDSTTKVTTIHSPLSSKNDATVSTSKASDLATKPTLQLQVETTIPRQGNRRVPAEAMLPASEEQVITSGAAQPKSAEPIPQTIENRLQRHIESSILAQVTPDLASEATDTIAASELIPQVTPETTDQSIASVTPSTPTTPSVPITNLSSTPTNHLVFRKEQEESVGEATTDHASEKSSMALLQQPLNQAAPRTTASEDTPASIPVIQKEAMVSSQTTLNPVADEVPTVSVPAIADHYSPPSVQTKAEPVSSLSNQPASSFTIPDAWSSIDELLSRSRANSTTSTVQRLVNPLADQVPQADSMWGSPLESSQDDSWTSLLNAGEPIENALNLNRSDRVHESPGSHNTPESVIAADEETTSSETQTEASSDGEAQGETESDSLEALARGVYHLICQRLEIERERSGRYYTGRFPW